MEGPFPIGAGSGGRARAVRVTSFEELDEAARALDLSGLTALVVVGGAGGMSPPELRRLRPMFSEVIAPLAEQRRMSVIDGGTDTGVMRLMGRARAEGGHSFPLVGVIVDELAAHGSSPSETDAADPEPNHTHFVLVPGTHWGEEAPWLSRLASVSAGTAPSATVLVNGGEVAWDDVRLSVEAGRPVVVVEDSGRTADAVAAAAHGRGADLRANSLVDSGLVHVVNADDRAGLARLLDGLLAEGS